MDELLKKYIADIRRLKSPEVDKGALKLVISLARKYNHNEEDIMDLIQEGNIGLLIAGRRYDKTRGAKFTTYAYHWVKAYIMKEIDRRRKLRGIMDDDQELTETNEVRIIPGFVMDAEAEAQNRETKSEIAEIIHSLREREQLIIRLRYGFDGMKHNLSEIAKILGMSIEGIRKIERRILKKIAVRLNR